MNKRLLKPLVALLTILVVLWLGVKVFLHYSTEEPTNTPSLESIDPRIELVGESDYDKAMRYYVFAEAYHEGRGQEKDESKALAYYAKSCELGYGLGCMDAGAMTRDKMEASQYYEKGCDLGYLGACKNWNVLNGYDSSIPE